MTQLATRFQGDLSSSAGMDFAGEIMTQGGMMTQTRGQYTTAMSVQRQRALPIVQRRLMEEADLCGDDFYYGWKAGSDTVEGPSVKLALAAARCYGNCVIEQAPVIETATSWIFTAAFVDLETGFTVSRQFRQSKDWKVYGKLDDDRKMDIRFQIGQSKAIRNVVLNALPSGLISNAMERAKSGVRAKIEARVKEKGLAAAVTGAMEALAKAGVKEANVLSKFSVAKREAITIEHLVTITGDLKSITSGQAWASEVYPDPDTNGASNESAGLNAKLQAPPSPEPPKQRRNTKPEPEPEPTSAEAAEHEQDAEPPEQHEETRPAEENLDDFDTFRQLCFDAAMKNEVDPEVFSKAFVKHSATTKIKSVRRNEREPARKAVLAAWRAGKIDLNTGTIIE